MGWFKASPNNFGIFGKPKLLGFIRRVYCSRYMKNVPWTSISQTIQSTPTPRNTHGPRRRFPPFSHLNQSSFSCHVCVSGKHRGEQMTWLSGSSQGTEPAMTTESCQHKPSLSEEAAELWLQQMSRRLCDDIGPVLKAAYTFHLLNSLAHEVTSFPGPECPLSNWSMICRVGDCLSKLIGKQPPPELYLRLGCCY